MPEPEGDADATLAVEKDSPAEDGGGGGSKLTMSEAQGQSAKLALVEARVELEELRKELVAANADRAAARLEQKADRELARLAAERNEASVVQLRRMVEAVRESLQVEIVRAEDAAHIATEMARKQEAAWAGELRAAREATRGLAASAIQRVFNKKLTKVLREKLHVAQARADTAGTEIQKLTEELESAQGALKSSAARTLQRANKRRMALAVRAAGGNVDALQTMHEERRLSDVRQLESEQAELRTALNESRRRAARLEKRMQQVEGGDMIIASALHQCLAAEVFGLECDLDAAVARSSAVSGVNARRMLHMSLKLSAAQAKARVMGNQAADADAKLFSAQQAAEVAAVRAFERS